MIINNNIPALNTYRQMGINQNAAQSAMEKLSSGLRINRAGDDAAGLAISEKMRAQIRGLDQASRNAQDGISMIQTAEGALDETHSILQRMRELATQAANDTNVDVDREEIQKEMNQLTSEINRIGNTTEFNTQNLLNGGEGTGEAATGSAEIGETEVNVTGWATEDAITVTFVQGEEGDSEISAEWSGETLTITIGQGADSIAAGDLNSAISEATGEAPEGANISFSYTGELEQSEFGTNSITVDGGSEGEAGEGFSANFQIGANQGQSMTIEIADMRAAALGISGASQDAEIVDKEGEVIENAAYTAVATVTDGTDNQEVEYALDVSSHESAAAAVTVINDAIESVSAQRSELGAFQNRLEHTISNLDNASENLSAAESRIRDVDYANAA